VKDEKPIRVVPGKGRKHRTETRIFAREIHETFCKQPGCKWNGQHAQQGACHTREPFVPGTSWSYVDKVEKYAHEAMVETRKYYRKDPKDYIRHLESQHIADWMNSVFHLDEVVRLRRKVALLEHATKGGKK
jgi:hypothetical protein